MEYGAVLTLCDKLWRDVFNFTYRQEGLKYRDTTG